MLSLVRDLFRLQSAMSNAFSCDLEPPYLTYRIQCRDNKKATLVARAIESWRSSENWDGKMPSATTETPHEGVVEIHVYDIETTLQMLSEIGRTIQDIRPAPPTSDWVNRVTASSEASAKSP